MIKQWVAIIRPKARNRLTDEDYDVKIGDTPKALLQKLMRMKYWYEVESVQLVRKEDAIERGINLEGKHG